MTDQQLTPRQRAALSAGVHAIAGSALWTISERSESILAIIGTERGPAWLASVTFRSRFRPKKRAEARERVLALLGGVGEGDMTLIVDGCTVTGTVRVSEAERALMPVVEVPDEDA